MQTSSLLYAILTITLADAGTTHRDFTHLSRSVPSLKVRQVDDGFHRLLPRVPGNCMSTGNCGKSSSKSFGKPKGEEKPSLRAQDQSPPRSRGRTPGQTPEASPHGASHDTSTGRTRSLSSDSSLGAGVTIGRSRSPSPGSSERSSRGDPDIPPVRVKATLSGPGYMMAYKGRKEVTQSPGVDAKIHRVAKGETLEKEWTHPKNIVAYVSNKPGGEHIASSSGQHAETRMLTDAGGHGKMESTDQGNYKHRLQASGGGEGRLAVTAKNSKDRVSTQSQLTGPLLTSHRAYNAPGRINYQVCEDCKKRLDAGHSQL